MCTSDLRAFPRVHTSCNNMTAVAELAGQHTVAYRVYKEARKSVLVALSLLLLLGGGLAVFVMKMPALQVRHAARRG